MMNTLVEKTTPNSTVVSFLNMISKILMLLGTFSSSSNGNEEVHPWKKCDPDWYQLCPVGNFCSFDHGLEGIVSTCINCPENPRKDCFALEYTDERAVNECLAQCDRSEENDSCSPQGLMVNNNNCPEGNMFCNYEDEDIGTCQKCNYKDELECLKIDNGIYSEYGQEDCKMQCHLKCYPIHTEKTIIDEHEINSLAMSGSPDSSVNGPLVDCTSLLYDEKLPSARDAVCLVHDVTKSTYYIEILEKCERNGCNGVIFFGSYGSISDDEPCVGDLTYINATIPAVCVSYDDGKALMQEDLGSIANVTTGTQEILCWKEQLCDKTNPCVGHFGVGRGYCATDHEDVGFCQYCPVDENNEPDPSACFFGQGSGLGYMKYTTQDTIESCASSCGSRLSHKNCKFCPQEVSGLEFGVESESERCYFCPENDVEFPDRVVPLFGDNIKCWQIQSFFSEVEIHVDSENCQLAQMMNYICGCKGPGYAGASTDKKKIILVWVPRVMAILSILGSSCIIYDVMKSIEKREFLKNQLMVALSIFDIIGALSYALTSLPTPENDHIYGSRGNRGTCSAQGFFIQVGTISCYINVSLVVYYYLRIKHRWGETRMKHIRKWFFICPVFLGLTFSFAGIPFYDNMLLWCNNSANWWPDIPVAIAIAVATTITINICYFVYSTDRDAFKWSLRNTGKYEVTHRVFWKSFWYLMAFYVTWVPYLALQYSWASGKAFSNYGFILAAGIMVPLQGFWNCFVYFRNYSKSNANASSILTFENIPDKKNSRRVRLSAVLTGNIAKATT